MAETRDVESYLAQTAEGRRPALAKLRRLCRRNLPGYQECIAYGVPGYQRNGVVEVSFADRKQYLALYVLNKEVLDEFRDALAASSIGKGCVRFTKPEQIDFAVIERLLRRVAESRAAICP